MEYSNSPERLCDLLEHVFVLDVGDVDARISFPLDYPVPDDYLIFRLVPKTLSSGSRTHKVGATYVFRRRIFRYKVHKDLLCIPMKERRKVCKEA